MTEDPDELPVKSCDHPMRVAARTLSEISLVLQHWIRFTRCCEDVKAQIGGEEDWQSPLGSSWWSQTLWSINNGLRGAWDVCQPRILSPWYSLTVECTLEEIIMNANLLYQEFSGRLSALRDRADQPWHDTSEITELINVLADERDRLTAFLHTLPGYRNLSPPKIEVISPDDERLANTVFIPIHPGEPPPDQVLMVTSDPVDDPSYAPQINGVSPASRDTAKELLQTVYLFTQCLQKIEETSIVDDDSGENGDVLQVGAAGDRYHMKITAAIESTRIAVDAIHPLFASDMAGGRPLGDILRQLRRDYLDVCDSLTHRTGELRLRSASPELKLLRRICRLAEKLRVKQAADPSC